MTPSPRPLQPYASASSFFGSRLRELRADRGLSQDRLAACVHVSGDLISKVERAVRRPQADLVKQLDVALAADGELLALASTMRNDAGQDAVEPSPETISASGSSAVNPELVAALRVVLTGLRQMDHSLAPGAVLASVLAQAKVAEGLLPATSPAVRTSLLSILAETYQLAGWIQFDQNNPGSADLSLQRARHYAVEADDEALLAFILGPSHGFAVTYSGNPQLGLALAERATQAAERCGNARLIGFTLAIQARALARLGDVTRCHRQLDAAAEQLARHDKPDADPVWLGVFDDAALRGHRGSCELDLQRPDRAIVSLSEHHAAASPAYPRNRTIWLLDRADALAAVGEPEGACADVRIAWQTAIGTSSRRTLRRFGSTLAGLQRWHDLPEVAEVQVLVTV
jgi:transcriptional regulator with XRE-family HTH domain